MGKGNGFDVRILGLEKLHAKLASGKIAKVGLAKSLEEVATIAAQAAKDAAPVATGKLKRSVQGKLRSTGRSAVVEATATKKSNQRRKRKSWPHPYPYGRRLEWEAKNPHYQWMHTALERSASRWESALEKGGKEVASYWKKKL